MKFETFIKIPQGEHPLAEVATVLTCLKSHLDFLFFKTRMLPVLACLSGLYYVVTWWFFPERRDTVLKIVIA